MYRTEQLALLCVQKKLCKHFNAPEADRRRTFSLQVALAYALHFILIRLSPSDPCVRDLSVRLELLSAELTKLECGSFFMQQVCVQVEAELKKIWQKECSVSSYLLELAQMIEHMCSHLEPWWDAHPNEGAKAIWQGIVLHIRTFAAQMNEQGKAVDFRNLNSYLWPEKPTQQLKLYLLGERFWVAAYTREQARSLIKKKYGLLNLRVQGIDLGEIMEDGRSARDLLNLASGKPCVLGRTE
ncbi:MAG: hypothetical protein IK079_02875 [Desulfovibrio sp.]|nr:hypothetical protein [Desulfovibrio sp.]